MQVYGAWFGLINIALDASRATQDAAATSRIASEALGDSEPWQPTIQLAEYTQSVLALRGEYVASIAARAAPVPGMENKDYTFFGENWLKPIRQWHREKVSSVDFADFDPADADYVLEVAISNYELTGGRFLLAVNMKLVDPSSREVLASTRKWKQFRTPDFDELFENDAAQFRDLYEASSQELVDKALLDLELI